MTDNIKILNDYENPDDVIDDDINPEVQVEGPDDNLDGNLSDDLNNLSDDGDDSPIKQTFISQLSSNDKSDDKLTTDDIEYYQFQHNPNRDKIQRAYDIVRQFIISRKRILTGGMAIDYALRAKGSKLYTSDKIDYDFFSPEFHKDAYALTDIIAGNSKNTSAHAIGAMHITTMRVRYRFMVVADITYIPPDIYHQIPTINYQDMIIVHPCFQIIDQNLSLSRPFENPPLENISGERLEKDLWRMKLFTDVYDIPEELRSLAESRGESKSHKLTDYKPVKNKPVKVKIQNIRNQCLSGLAAAAYWLDDLTISEDHIEYSAPNDCVTILTDDYADTVEHYTSLLKAANANNQTKKEYRPCLDKLPQRTYFDNFEILDNKGFFTAAVKLDKFYVASIHNVLVYLFTNILLFDRFDLVETCIVVFNKLFELLESKKYKLLLTYYGSKNMSHANHLSLEKTKAAAEGKQLDVKIPPHYYPGPDKTEHPEFNIDDAPEYQFN